LFPESSAYSTVFGGVATEAALEGVRGGLPPQLRPNNSDDDDDEGKKALMCVWVFLYSLKPQRSYPDRNLGSFVFEGPPRITIASRFRSDSNCDELLTLLDLHGKLHSA
jgi:hypothetical protein